MSDCLYFAATRTALLLALCVNPLLLARLCAPRADWPLTGAVAGACGAALNLAVPVVFHLAAIPVATAPLASAHWAVAALLLLVARLFRMPLRPAALPGGAGPALAALAAGLVLLVVPFTPLAGIDTYKWQGLATNVRVEEAVPWLVHPLSLLGFTPRSYPSAHPLLLATAQILGGLSVETGFFAVSVFVALTGLCSAWTLGRRLFDSPGAAAWMGALYALSPVFIRYAHWATGRGLFLALLPLYLAVLLRAPRPRALAATAPLALLLALSHKAGLVAALALPVFHLLGGALPRLHVRGLAAAAAVPFALAAILFAPGTGLSATVLAAARLHVSRFGCIGLLAAVALAADRAWFSQSARRHLLPGLLLTLPVAHAADMYGAMIALPYLCAAGTAGVTVLLRDGTSRRRAIALTVALLLAAGALTIVVRRSVQATPHRIRRAALFLNTYDPRGPFRVLATGRTRVRFHAYVDGCPRFTVTPPDRPRLRLQAPPSWTGSPRRAFREWIDYLRSFLALEDVEVAWYGHPERTYVVTLDNETEPADAEGIYGKEGGAHLPPRRPSGPRETTEPKMNALHVSLLVACVVLLAAVPSGAFTWPLWVVAIVLAAAAAFQASRSPSIPLPRMLWVLYAAFLSLLLLSVLPLPLELSPLLGARRHAQNLTVAEALNRARALGVLDSAGPPLFALTRNRAGALRMLFLTVTAFSAVALAASLRPPWPRTCLRVLVGIGALIGLAGLAGEYWVPQGDTLWWVLPVPHSLPGPIGGFRSRNVFGGFLALLSPAALGLFIDDVRHGRPLHAVVNLAALSALAAAVVFTLSRGAIAALLAGFAAMAALHFARGERRLGVALILVPALAVLVVAVLPYAPLQARLRMLVRVTETDSYQTRVSAWKDAVTIWRHYPLLGAGVNAFRTVYPLHRTSSTSAFMTHAENEYIQTFAETGVVGVLLCGGLAFVVVRGALLPAVRARAADGTLAVSGSAALAAGCAHALVDYPFHIPLYATLLGTLVGLVSASRADLASSSQPAPHARRTPVWVHAAAGAICALCAVFGARHLRLDSPRQQSTLAPDGVARSLAWAPTFSYAWYELGRRACMTGTEEALAFGERALTQAGTYDPKRYWLWREIGRLRLQLGDMEGARTAFARVKELRYWVPVPSVPGPPDAEEQDGDQEEDRP